MTQIADIHKLGVLPMRHLNYFKDGYELKGRITQYAAAVASLQRGRKVLKDESVDWFGDLNGGSLLVGSQARGANMWSYCQPLLEQRGLYYPARTTEFDADTGDFQGEPFTGPPNWRVPPGHMALIVAGSDQDDQAQLLIPIQDLRADHVNAGDDTSVFVNDSSGTDRGTGINSALNGPLGAFVRVVARAINGQDVAPALNFNAGGRTLTQAQRSRVGRGTFAENFRSDRADVAYLAAEDNMGPIFADYDDCQHAGDVVGILDENGNVVQFREAPGHISTNALFKVPGDNILDGPWAFGLEPQNSDLKEGVGAEKVGGIVMLTRRTHTVDGEPYNGQWVVTYRQVPVDPGDPQDKYFYTNSNRVAITNGGNPEVTINQNIRNYIRRQFNLLVPRELSAPSYEGKPTPEDDGRVPVTGGDRVGSEEEDGGPPITGNRGKPTINRPPTPRQSGAAGSGGTRSNTSPGGTGGAGPSTRRGQQRGGGVGGGGVVGGAPVGLGGAKENDRPGAERDERRARKKKADEDRRNARDVAEYERRKKKRDAEDLRRRQRREDKEKRDAARAKKAADARERERKREEERREAMGEDRYWKNKRKEAEDRARLRRKVYGRYATVNNPEALLRQPNAPRDFLRNVNPYEQRGGAAGVRKSQNSSGPLGTRGTASTGNRAPTGGSAPVPRAKVAGVDAGYDEYRTEQLSRAPTVWHDQTTVKRRDGGEAYDFHRQPDGYIDGTADGVRIISPGDLTIRDVRAQTLDAAKLSVMLWGDTAFGWGNVDAGGTSIVSGWRAMPDAKGASSNLCLDPVDAEGAAVDDRFVRTGTSLQPRTYTTLIPLSEITDFGAVTSGTIELANVVPVAGSLATAYVSSSASAGGVTTATISVGTNAGSNDNIMGGVVFTALTAGSGTAHYTAAGDEAVTLRIETTGGNLADVTGLGDGLHVTVALTQGSTPSLTLTESINSGVFDFSSNGKGQVGNAESYTFTASSLVGGLTIAATGGYQISKTGRPGTWAQPLSYGDTSYPTEKVFVRLNPTGPGVWDYAGTITHTANGLASQVIELQGYDVWSHPAAVATFRGQDLDDGLVSSWPSQESADYAAEQTGAARPTATSGVLAFAGTQHMLWTQELADLMEQDDIGFLVVCTQPTGAQVINSLNSSTAYSAVNLNGSSQLVANDTRPLGGTNKTATQAGAAVESVRGLYAPRGAALEVIRDTTVTTGGTTDNVAAGPFNGDGGADASALAAFISGAGVALLRYVGSIKAVMFFNDDFTPDLAGIIAGLEADGSKT